MPRTNFKDLSGQIFGQLTVSFNFEIKNKRTYWFCICSCGNSCKVRADQLKSQHTTTCGHIKGKHTLSHGLSYTNIYHIWSTAKSRAKKHKVPFTLIPEDMPEVPEYCPILNLKLELGKGKPTDCSPSLDRIIPKLGYIKGNVKIISHRANKIKNYGTAEEHMKIAQYIIENSKIKEGN